MTRKTHRHGLIEPLENRLLMAIIPVLNNNDSGAGSLRQAIADAASGDSIDLSSRFGKIYLTSGQIAISGKSVTLTGPGVLDLKIQGNNSRLFDISSTGGLTISNLTLTKGNSGGETGGIIRNAGSLELSRVSVSYGLATGRGGAIHQTGIRLTLTDCSFNNNQVQGNGSSARGGAIDISGPSPINYISTITNCLFHNNQVGNLGSGSNGNAFGGAVAVGQAVKATFLNCTFHRNYADGSAGVGRAASGGGLHLDGSPHVEINQCTFAYNSAVTNNGAVTSPASGGGGLAIRTSIAVLVCNSIFKNSSSTGLGPDVYDPGSYAETRGNVLSSSANARGFQFDISNYLDSFVEFYPLANNGGPTWTLMPQGYPIVWQSTSYSDARGYDRAWYNYVTPGAVETYTPPQDGFGLALRFDGPDNVQEHQVLIGRTPALELQQFTIEAWAKISPVAEVHSPIYAYFNW
jgi:hypothetical protein